MRISVQSKNNRMRGNWEARVQRVDSNWRPSIFENGFSLFKDYLVITERPFTISGFLEIN